MSIEYIKAKTIISGYSAKNEWFGCNYNMNIYKGCSHGCIYCDSRSDCYNIENFDSVRVKENAIKIIQSELKKKRRVGVIGTGSMSDPYNSFEHELLLTREALKLIDIYSYGVSIATKSSMIVRDIDILSKIKRHSPLLCKLTITTADDNMSSIIEPNVSNSEMRFAAIKELSKAGIFAGVLLMPVLPYITDTKENIKNIVRLAYENGAKFVFCMLGVTLRANQREYYYRMLDKHFPDLKSKYISSYGSSYSCSSVYSKELWNLFTLECKKYDLLYKMDDIIKAYREGYSDDEVSLF